MDNKIVEIPEAHIELWKARISSYGSISKLLRDLAKEYGAHRNDAGIMLYALFENFSSEELPCIWNWDFENNGIGVTDERLDQLLAHLLPLPKA